MNISLHLEEEVYRMMGHGPCYSKGATENANSGRVTLAFSVVPLARLMGFPGYVLFPSNFSMFMPTASLQWALTLVNLNSKNLCIYYSMKL